MSLYETRLPEHLRWPEFCHPLDQAHMWSNEIPCEAQLDIIRAFAELRYVIATFPNSGGKTSLVLPVCIMSAMCAFPGAMCYVMGGSEAQLINQLFLQHLFPKIERLDGWKTWRGDRPRIRAPNGSEVMGYVAADALKVEGFHGHWSNDIVPGKRVYRPLFYFTDESKGIPNDKITGVERIEPDFWLAVTSPGTDGQHWTYNAINPDELDAEVRKRSRRLGLPEPLPPESALFV